MHSKRDNIKFTITLMKLLKNLFELLLNEYQIGLETSMRGSDFIFNCVYLLYYKLRLLNLHSVALGSIKKNISFFNLYLLYFNCSKLKQMFRSWFNFAVFFLPKLIINRIFLNTFQIGNLITDWDNWNIFLIRFEQLRERSSSLITVNTSESFKSLWSQYITSCFFWSTER